MAYTFSTELVSDLHKDAFGHRPGSDFWDMWHNGLSDKGRQAEWDYMVKAVEREIEDDKLREQYALEDFENKLGVLVESGAGNEITALRWMTQTETFQHSQDAEQWVWSLGILFTDRGREIVKMLKGIYKFEY